MAVGFRFFGESFSEPLPPSSVEEILRFFFFSACTGLPEPERLADLDLDRERDLDLDFVCDAGVPLRDRELEKIGC